MVQLCNLDAQQLRLMVVISYPHEYYPPTLSVCGVSVAIIEQWGDDA